MSFLAKKKTTMDEDTKTQGGTPIALAVPAGIGASASTSRSNNIWKMLYDSSKDETYFMNEASGEFVVLPNGSTVKPDLVKRQDSTVGVV